MNALVRSAPQATVTEASPDLAERIAGERRQAHLASEVLHRVQNTLTVVQSLAHMSFAGLPREIVLPFEQRLMALAAVHELLVQTAWERADLQRILERVSDTFDFRDRVHICGPAVGVTPTAAVTYGLAFQELCADAVRHGVFSEPGGRLDVSWRLVQPELGRFHLIWREYDGPPSAASVREGLGSRMLKRALTAQLGTSVIIRYLEDGLVCEFEGPVQRSPVSMLELNAATRTLG